LQVFYGIILSVQKGQKFNKFIHLYLNIILKNMRKKFFINITVLSCALALSFALITPAKAFYLEVPQFVKDIFQKIKSNSVAAQESAATISPEQTTQPTEQQTIPTQENQNTYNMPAYSQPINDQMNQQPTQTCNINGVETPGACSNYPSQNNFQNQPMIDGQSGEQQSGGQQYGPGPMDEEKMKQQQEQQLKDMKRGATQMERRVKQFETVLAKEVKKGTAIPEGVNEKLVQAKAMIDKLKNATTVEEIQDFDMSEFNDIMDSLEEIRQNVFEAAQRLAQIKKDMDRGPTKGLKEFEKQLAKLKKQKITIPAEITDGIAKIKEILSVIKNAKTLDEVESAGLEDLSDLFDSMDQYRQQLEYMSRWPQTLKQVDKQMTNLNKSLKRMKTIVASLAKKEIDLQSNYTAFEEAVAKMKTVRDEAVAKVQAGVWEDALDMLENDFFGQMDDVMQNQIVIESMSNLGRFTSNFKTNISSTQRQINSLKKKKIDITELQELLDQAKTKGNEVVALIKVKPIDAEAILSGMEEMEDLRQQFGDKYSELSGSVEDMPWEQGQPQQVQSLNMPSSLNQYVNKN